MLTLQKGALARRAFLPGFQPWASCPALGEQPRPASEDQQPAETGRTGQLGVVLEAVGSSEPDSLLGSVTAGSAVRRTFDGAIMAGLNAAARELEVPALVVYPGGGQSPLSYLGGRVDGLLEALRNAPLPVVALWTENVPPGMSAVDVDHQAGGALATRHLLDLGHRRIAFYGGGEASGVEHFPRREFGYRQAMLAAGLPVQRAIHEGGLLIEAVRAGQVSAVFAETDLAAAAVARALTHAGLSVPGDVSLVGFDDILGAEYIASGLTTIYHPAAEMAAEGVHALMRRLQGGQPEQLLLASHLIVRRSTDRMFES